MAKELKYYGEFLSVTNILWRVEIHKEYDGVNPNPEEVIFPVDPLSIEWKATTKTDVIESSAVTLTLESDSDRRFVGLYSVEVGEVILKIYRNGMLYWCGSLDTELYEEPFAYDDHYDVSLTFSDFAPLERLNWESKGFISKHNLVVEALTLAGIEYIGMDKYISTQLSSVSQPIDLTELYDLGENYFDEQGEPMNVLEVLTESLKPLALRIRQIAGRIVIYDINSINSFSTTALVWDSTDSALSVEETFNNISVAFSPYADTVLMDCAQEAEIAASDSPTSHMVYVDNERSGGDFKSPEGFRFKAGEKGGENLTLGGGAKFFSIKSEYSGSNEAGVAYSAKGLHSIHGTYYNLFKLKEPHDINASSSMIMRTNKKFISSELSSSKYHSYRLKLRMDFLFDVRYNPFEMASRPNEEGNWQRLQDWCNFAYVPIKIQLKDDAGNVLYHYNNKASFDSSRYDIAGTWIAGAAAYNSCFLAYYDIADRKAKSGLGGWAKNRPMIGYYRDSLPSSIEILAEGDFIPLPPASGWLEIEVLSGVHQFDYNREVKDIYSLTRWVMYKDLNVELVNANGTPVDLEDIEIVGWINKKAKETLSISTISGTMPEPLPSARGLIFDSLRRPITSFYRGGTVTTAERLLINTAYSQYAKRNTSLAGTVKQLNDFGIYTDDNADGKYMLLSDIQSPYYATSEILAVEIHTDTYKGVEYDE